MSDIFRKRYALSCGLTVGFLLSFCVVAYGNDLIKKVESAESRSDGHLKGPALTASEDRIDRKQGSEQIYTDLATEFSKSFNDYVSSVTRCAKPLLKCDKFVSVFLDHLSDSDIKKIHQLQDDFLSGLQKYQWDPKLLSKMHESHLFYATQGGGISAVLVSGSVYKILPFEMSLKESLQFLKNIREKKQMTYVEFNIGMTRLKSFVRAQSKKIADDYGDPTVAQFRNDMANLYMNMGVWNPKVNGVDPGDVLELAALYGDTRVIGKAQDLIRQAQINPELVNAPPSAAYNFRNAFGDPAHNNVPNAVRAIALFQYGSADSMQQAQELLSGVIKAKENPQFSGLTNRSNRVDEL